MLLKEQGRLSNDSSTMATMGTIQHLPPQLFRAAALVFFCAV